MIAVDTNVLMRFLLRDDAEQHRRVREWLVKAQHRGDRLWVPQVVIQEVFWQLIFQLKVPLPEAVRQVDGLLSIPVFEVEAAARVAKAIRVMEEHRIDFTDAMLAAISHEKGFEGVLSFDRDMGRIGARWVRP